MTAICLPSRLAKTCQQLENDPANEAALNRFLKSKVFAGAVLTHKKNHTDSSIGEYTAALQNLLNHYKAGQPVNVNELANAVSEYLSSTRAEAERTLSRNALLNSFIPFLHSVGIIEGNKPMTWAYLNTPHIGQKLLTNARNWYRASLEKTESEVQHLQAQRNQTALRKLEAAVLANRSLQEDIRHHLDYIKKEDGKCQEIASSLGVAYSTIKEDAMKKRNAATTGGHIKNYAFAGIALSVLVAGFLATSGKEAGGAPVWQEATDSAPSGEYRNGEQIWRARYIELYRQNGKPTPAMEQEMIRLSGEYMLSMQAMRDIVAGIRTEEISQ